MRFLLLVLLMLFLVSCSNSVEKWCVDENCFDLELADNIEERRKGLMFRESLGENEGMLFVFSQKGDYPFWMKNTLIPLDMIWLDENFKVVKILEAEPCEEDPCPSYDPKVQAKYVVELNKGSSRKLSIEEGDFFSN